MNNSLSGKILKGFSWTAIERIVSQLVIFIIGIVVARLVTPSEYGVLGILMVFINVSSVFVDSGLGNSLIYYNELKERDLRTTFSLNIFISIFLMLLIYLFSSLIENFYQLENLALYLQIISFTILFNAFVVVPTAILKVKLNFRSLAISNICSSVISGILAIVMAYQGYGIWALIAQVMVRSFLQAFFLVILSKWIPRLVFYKESFIRLYRYGINLITASCLTKVTEEGISFFLGKVFSPYNLGIYTRATQFSVLPSTSIGNVVISVLFPTLSLVKDDKDKFKQIYNAIIKIMSALSMPVFVFLVVIAEPFIRLALTEKWIAVVPFLQVFCIGRLFFPISNVTEQALNAVGRSDLFLKQQIRKMAVKAIFILPALFFDIYVVAIADALSSLAAYFITTMVARKVLNIRLFDQMRSFIWYMIFAIGAGVLSYYVELFIANDYLKIILSIIIFIIIYSVLIFSFKRTEILNFRKVIK